MKTFQEISRRKRKLHVIKKRWHNYFLIFLTLSTQTLFSHMLKFVLKVIWFLVPLLWWWSWSQKSFFMFWFYFVFMCEGNWKKMLHISKKHYWEIVKLMSCDTVSPIVFFFCKKAWSSRLKFMTQNISKMSEKDIPIIYWFFFELSSDPFLVLSAQWCPIVVDFAYNTQNEK